MQISSINSPDKAFGGLFSSLLGLGRSEDRKQYTGRHFEKRQSSLDCSSNYNRPLVQNRNVKGRHLKTGTILNETVQKPKIDTGSLFRMFTSRVEPEVSYIIDTDTKIALDNNKIFDLSSIQLRKHTNFLEDGETLYINPTLPSREACQYSKGSNNKIALTKISSSVFMLRVPKGVDGKVFLLPNVEYIDSDAKFPVLMNGTKYAVQKNSVIEIDGSSFCLNDFDIDSLEDKEQIVIRKSMLKKDDEPYEAGDLAPLAYITKSKDVIFFSLAPDTTPALYCGTRPVSQMPQKAEAEVQKFAFEDEKITQNDNLPEPVSYSSDTGLDEVISVEVVLPDELSSSAFETSLRNTQQSIVVPLETDLTHLPYTMSTYSFYDSVFANECVQKSQTSGIMDPETLAQYKKIINMVSVFLKGQEFSPSGLYMGTEDENGVQHLIFAGYKNRLLSKINIIDISPSDLKSAKLTSFNLDSVNRLPEDKAGLVHTFLKYLSEQGEADSKSLEPFDGLALPLGDN